HREGHQRELADQFVGVVAHACPRPAPASLGRRGEPIRPRVAERSGRSLAALEMLMRRAVVAIWQRRALAGFALAGRRAAASDATVERAGLDLLFDEAHGRVHPLRD